MPNRRDDAPRARRGSDRDQQAKEQDLHATEDSIRADLSRLSVVEGEKARLDPKDPEVDRLSDEAVELAERLGRKTRAERQLGQDLA